MLRVRVCGVCVLAFCLRGDAEEVTRLPACLGHAQVVSTKKGEGDREYMYA